MEMPPCPPDGDLPRCERAHTICQMWTTRVKVYRLSSRLSAVSLLKLSLCSAHADFGAYLDRDRTGQRQGCIDFRAAT